MLAALEFTLLEAILSAVLSTVLGAVLAMLWMRVDFKGKTALEALMLLPFFLPALFVVLAVIRFFGRGFLDFEIYGLVGIVLAHLILNIPLAFYMVLSEWRRVPYEMLMTAQSIGAVGRLIERPVLRRALPQAFWLIMLYCALSFTIVLVMGGGPSNSTLEVAIYQAIRYEFDLPKAFALSAIQAGLGLVILFLAKGRAEPFAPNAHRLDVLGTHLRPVAKFAGAVVMLLIIGFVFLPVIGLFMAGVFEIPKLIATLNPMSFAQAFWNSLWASIIFGIVVNGFAFALAAFRYDGLAWVIAAISPLALSTMIILLLRIFVNPFDFGLPVIILIQSFVLSPLFVRLWRGALDKLAPEEKMILQSITHAWPLQWRLYYWPRLRADALRFFGLAVAFAFGDLALYPLMAPSGFINMPILIWQLISSYQFGASAALVTLNLVMIVVLILMSQIVAKNWELRHA